MEIEVIDLGARHGHTQKTLLHMLVDAENEEDLSKVLENCLQSNQQESKEVLPQYKDVQYINLDINAQDLNGFTPLISVIVCSHIFSVKVIKLMVKLGADPFLKSNDGRNAFHWATRIGEKPVLETLVSCIPSSDVTRMLNIPVEDGYELKPIHIAARFDNLALFEYIMELEQKCSKTCLHTTYLRSKDPNKDFIKVCPLCFEDNNIYSPNSKGDSLLHIIVRFGAIKVFHCLLVKLMDILTKCKKSLGPIDYKQEGLTKEYTNPDEIDEEPPAPEFSQKFLEYMGIDGDYVSTDEIYQEDTQEEKKKSPDKIYKCAKEIPVLSKDASINEFTDCELALMRKTILKILSHKNNKGDTIIVEAIKSNQEELLLSIRMSNLVRQDPIREREVCLGAFFDKYEKILVKIENRKRKKRKCVFWENDEDDEPEESISLDKINKDLSEERKRLELKSIALFIFLFVVFLCISLFCSYVFLSINYAGTS
ncbi:unnamed protein product [Moneuplotes crassus]|uniref:ANK_REP_REGION domain-containing protein n=1 Tax=Euplotes crassus TaxID=5936 RepID=A0AAD1UBJ6_EUPCR|nr:unnamed protein product [Moneuplotes crassus]